MVTWIRIAAFLMALWGAAPVLAQRATPVALLHPSGAADDRFGYSVAINGDTAIVGAWRDDVGGNTNQGSAHIYRWTGAGWALEATLTAPDGAAFDEFGVSVAISGDTAIVGANGHYVGVNAYQGAAYVFTRSGTIWTHQAQLTAGDGAADDQFGISVGLAGDTAIVGSYLDSVGVNGSQGSAYVFIRSGSTWTQQAQLIAADGAASDRFGNSVAISGDTVVVGAQSDDVSTNENQGSAYVFVRTGTTWTQEAQLTNANGEKADGFGSSVAIDRDTTIVGATLAGSVNQGAAYVFTRSGSMWTQQAQLTAADGTAGDYFAISVAISGHTAIVGSYSDDLGANANQGSACIFVRSGTAWSQQATLIAPDGATADQFGFSVAISNDTAILGAWCDDVGANINQGSAWVFSRVGSRWIGPDLKLLAPDGSEGDAFGRSVALEGDTAVVGAFFDSVGTNSVQGSAHVFVRSGTIWTQQATLTASDGAAHDGFGVSVGISGDTAIVGSGSDDVGSNADQGSAYIFVRSGTVWNQRAKLTALDGAWHDNFGGSVAISGDTAIVGAPSDDVGANTDQGSAYVFRRSGTIWTQEAKRTASDGGEGDYFGSSVALFGDTALVGAFRDDVGANTDQGSAYIFSRSGTIWTQRATLTASDGRAGDWFGYSVAISGDTAIVGSVFDDVGANADQGSAYVFSPSGTTWAQQAALTASDGGEGDWFGYSVAISGETAIVGAKLDDVGSNANQGSASVFGRLGMFWTQQAQVTATGGAAGDVFGSAVALSGDTALVGAYADDVGANTDQGAAWVLDIGTECPSDLNSNGFVDDSDFSIFLVAYDLLDCEDPFMPAGCPADLNADASVDDADFQIFVVAYDALLCP